MVFVLASTGAGLLTTINQTLDKKVQLNPDEEIKQMPSDLKRITFETHPINGSQLAILIPKTSVCDLLQLQNCMELKDDDFDVLKKCPVKRLELGHLQEISGDKIVDVVLNSKIKTLALTNCPNLTKVHVENMITNSEALKTIHVCGTNLTPEEMIAKKVGKNIIFDVAPTPPTSSWCSIL
jgi:hypothetical protein